MPLLHQAATNTDYHVEKIKQLTEDSRSNNESSQSTICSICDENRDTIKVVIILDITSLCAMILTMQNEVIM